MNISIGYRTRKAVLCIICGDVALDCDKPLSAYRTHAQLSEYFLEDLRLDPTSIIEASRPNKTESLLKFYNGKKELKCIIEGAVRPEYYNRSSFAVEDAVKHLNDFLKNDGYQLIKSGNRYILIMSLGVPLVDEGNTSPAILTDEYVSELHLKCEQKLNSNDYEGAITNARTLIEAVLVDIEVQLTGKRHGYKGDLPQQFKAVTKSMRLDEERDLDQRFKDVVRGLGQVVHGLAPLRNKMSDGHARERKPAPHHARLVVNASVTVSRFLVESFVFQTGLGLLKPHESKGITK